MVESHEVEQGGVEIVDRGWVDCGFESEFITLSITVAFLNSGARHEACKGTWVVVTTGSIRL